MEGVVGALLIEGGEPGSLFAAPAAGSGEVGCERLVFGEEIGAEGEVLRGIVVAGQDAQMAGQRARATEGVEEAGQVAAGAGVAAAADEPEVAGGDERICDGDEVVVGVAGRVANFDGLSAQFDPVAVAESNIVPRRPALGDGGCQHLAAERSHHLVVAGDVVGVAMGHQNPDPRGVELPDRSDSNARVHGIDQDGISSMMKKVEEVVGHGRREGLELHEGSEGLEEEVIEARVGRTAGPGIPWEERFEVERNYHGWRIDRYLAEKMHRASRAQAANIVKHGLWLDERWVTKQGATVRAAQVIRIPRLEFADPATPSLDEVSVLHDDGAAVVEALNWQSAGSIATPARDVAADRRAEARMKGYVGEACPECQNFTLVRNGTCLKCDTCGSTTGCS